MVYFEQQLGEKKEWDKHSLILPLSVFKGHGLRNVPFLIHICFKVYITVMVLAGLELTTQSYAFLLRLESHLMQWDLLSSK